MSETVPRIERLARFSLTTADANRAAVFYEAAFGCHTISSCRLGGTDFENVMGVRGGATRIVLALGQEVIELLQFDMPGAPYPATSSSCDLAFQHFAIVVSDMEKAYRHLLNVEGWSPISLGGPQRLPESSGGATAFKFRDPEGHPLELLAFPYTAGLPGVLCTGIDHSAISVSDTALSAAFYESLGLRVSAQSVNVGLEQNELDGGQGIQVEVSALSPPQARPHVELLCYRGVEHRPAALRRSNDIASTRLVFEARSGSSVAWLFHDPDGHALVIPERGTN